MTTRALLFTDLVDSTRLVERLGDVRAAEIWAEHDRRARDLLARCRGREIDRTDGFFLVFEAATDAACYAIAYHRELAELALAARVGLHVGPVTLRDNTPDDVARGAKRTEVEGLAKPLAARVMALARPGQSLLTRAALEAMADALPDAAEIEFHGHYRLKGVEAPVEIFEVGVRGVSAFSPPPDAEKAYRVVRAADLWRPVREVRNTLLAESDAFVGRTAELRELAARLDAGTRLLTVVGPGGTGKTRFVRRYGWSWLGDWPGGVYFTDLCEARSLDGILFAVAAALDVPLGKDDPGGRLGDAMAGRGRCLIILDNFEQIVAHASATLGRWLNRAGNAAFVVTSRERLHLPGEQIFALEPLPIASEAIELFTVRARAQRPDFVVTDGNRAAVAAVVSLLDGLPLAIELAAARVRVLSPAQLLERMRDRFGLLAGTRGVATRQATLRAAIDWSWDLLRRWEQAALAQCAVFDGGFPLEAAEAVLDLSPWPEAPAAIDAIEALVDKSLLRTWVPSDQGRYDFDEPFFGMYLSIHEYSAEKLRSSGPEAQRSAQERHGRYFARFGTDEALDALFQPGGVKRRRALVLEFDNIVAACSRAAVRGHGEVAVAAFRAAWEVIEMQGPLALGDKLGAQVLALEGIEPSLRAAACMTQGRIARRFGRMDEAGIVFMQALALARQRRDRRSEGRALGQLGILNRQQGRMAEALAYYEEALGVHREVGNRHAQGIVLGNLGILHSEQGRIGQALACFEQALAIHRETGDRLYQGIVLNNLGNVHSEQGRREPAQSYYQQALAIHREVGNRHEEGVALGNLGLLYHNEGRLDEAQAHYDAAIAIARDVGDRRHEGVVLGTLGTLQLDQGRSDAARATYDQALAIHRAVANRRSEGAVLGCLGELLNRQGRVDEARAALTEGEALLREVGDPLELGNLLCARGRAERSAGDIGLARANLAEAQTLAQVTGAGPESELLRAITRLREALA